MPSLGVLGRPGPTAVPVRNPSRDRPERCRPPTRTHRIPPKTPALLPHSIASGVRGPASTPCPQ
eukprot:21779-Eustigmatos_ZCMA.PRE.1